MLKVNNLSVKFSNQEILKNVNFNINPGDWLMVIGPNGAGKTTITNAIAQSVDYTGEILMEGENVKDMPARQRAKKLGVLMQNHFVSYSYTVKEIVALGAYSRTKGIFSSFNDEEEKVIDRALEVTGMEKFRNRSVLTLSGGELQRAFLTQLFVQNPKLMILDEPTNHLDLVYQESVFNLIDNWRKEKNRAVISVVHDLRLAKMYGDKALLLKNGEVFSFGDIDSVMTRENLSIVYNMDVYDWMNRLNERW